MYFPQNAIKGSFQNVTCQAEEGPLLANVSLLASSILTEKLYIDIIAHVQDAHAEEIGALKKLIRQAEENFTEAQKAHANSQAQQEARTLELQAETKELQAKINAFETALGKGSCQNASSHFEGN